MRTFWAGFYKQAADKQVASVAVMKDNLLLMGVRNDNGKWTTPGGHLEGDEKPIDGAVRELEEETGIKTTPNTLSFLKAETVTKGSDKLKVHGFLYRPAGEVEMDTSKDPDQEVNKWHWIKTDPLPSNVEGNLHVPFNKNILFNSLGISKRASEEKLTGGKADGKPDSDFDPGQLQKGIKVEREHTTDPSKAKEVAKDHLTEIPDYYDRLAKMEKSAFWRGFYG